MKARALVSALETHAFSRHKMAFVSGPRQCGKTTLAKMLLVRRPVGRYRNWDEIEFRRAWASNPSSVVPKAEDGSVPFLVLDEIHKDRRWKRSLKGLFDTLEAPCDILVTGSARLNVYRRGSDSLIGRHLTFRMHPFSLREIVRSDVPSPDSALEALFSGPAADSGAQGNLDALMACGPFPEPLLAQDVRQVRLWRHNREQMVIREDLRDLSRLPDLGRVEMMASLLPERVGSLSSMASLGRTLEASVPTIKRWLAYLGELYYLFEIRPYSKRVARSLRREGKVYLWDYGAVKDEAARFENLVAGHLLKACHYWTDTGEGEFELFFLRNKEKEEIDFLVVRDGEPWLPVEAKLGDAGPSPNWKRFLPALGCTRALQLVRQPAWKIHEVGEAKVLVAGAAEALACFA